MAKGSKARRALARALGLGLLAATLVVSEAAEAQAIDDAGRVAARALVKKGADAYNAGHFEEALGHFMEAFVTAKVPTVAVWIAKTHDRLGKLATASEYFESALVMLPNELWKSDLQTKAQREASTALQVLRPRIPKLKVTFLGADPSEVAISVDNVTVPTNPPESKHLLNPGEHTVTASCRGVSVTQTLTVKEAEERELPLPMPSVCAPAI